MPIRSGVIKHPPGKTFPSKYEGKPPRRNCVVVLPNGDEIKIYFDTPDLQDHLRKGDTVLVSGEKIELTEDLEAELRRRAGESAPLPASAAPATHAAASAARSVELSDDDKRQIAAYVGQMGAIYRFCWDTAIANLSGAATQEESIRAAASALFIAAQKHFNL